jgi:hypothetical protein
MQKPLETQLRGVHLVVSYTRNFHKINICIYSVRLHGLVEDAGSEKKEQVPIGSRQQTNGCSENWQINNPNNMEIHSYIKTIMQNLCFNTIETGSKTR